jgi:hypothetical protein
MAGTATRWNLVVTTDTDSELRQFLTSEGGGRKGDLSKFVEEAVKARIFELRVRRAKAENEIFPAEAIDDAVREALAWARKR